MTVPLNTKVDHRNGALSSIQICFHIPKNFQTNPPNSTNPKVKIIQRPKFIVYSMWVSNPEILTSILNFSTELCPQGIQWVCHTGYFWKEIKRAVKYSQKTKTEIFWRRTRRACSPFLQCLQLSLKILESEKWSVGPSRIVPAFKYLTSLLNLLRQLSKK